MEFFTCFRGLYGVLNDEKSSWHLLGVKTLLQVEGHLMGWLW